MTLDTSIRSAPWMSRRCAPGWTMTVASWSLATHNTDIGDGWEREAYGQWFFEKFSTKSYMVGVNVVVYAMTH